MKKKDIITLVSIIAIVVLSFVSYKYFFSDERRARNTVENYLESMKKGDTSKARKYLDDGSDTLIDVFAYKYLGTEDVYEFPNSDKNFLSARDYKQNREMVDKHGTFQMYVDYLTKLYENDKNIVVENTGDGVYYYNKKKDIIKEFDFLYDMEIANKGGQKLYKKVSFSVEKEDGKFLITTIGIR